MKKMSKAVAAASAIALVTAGAPAVAYAAPTAGPQDGVVVMAAPQTAAMWYVETGAGAGGDGTAAKPFSGFQDAYQAARPGDTIVLKNAVSILDGDDGKTDGAFALSKELTIASFYDKGALNSREAVVLGANLTLNGIEFAAPSISLNGHALSMNDVKEFKTNTVTPVVYGGRADGLDAPAGAHSSLTVKNNQGTQFVFQDIYAGSQSGSYAGDVDIDLQSGAKVLGTLSSDGAAGAVTGSVTLKLGRVSVARIVDEFPAAGGQGAALLATDFSPSDPVSIEGFGLISFERCRVKVDPDKFAGNGVVNLKQASWLDASASASPLKVESLYVQSGGVVKVNKAGMVEVKDVLNGTFELRIAGPAADTSGPALLDHAYLSAGESEQATVRFRPFATQAVYDLVKEDTDTGAQWVVRMTEKPLSSLDIAGESRAAIEAGDSEFAMTFFDADGAALAYEPAFDIAVKNPQGALFDAAGDMLEVYQDGDDASKLHVDILDDTMPAGTYTLVFTDVVSNVTIEKPFVFFKEGDPAPDPGQGPGSGGDPTPNPGDGHNPGGGAPGDTKPGGEGDGAVDPGAPDGGMPGDGSAPNSDGRPDTPTPPPAADSPDHEAFCPSCMFEDVDAGAWYREPLDYVVWNKLMTGVSNTMFEPDSTTTRAMTAMVLWRMAGAPEPQDISAFSDVAADAWYAKAVAWAAEAGVAHGYGDGAAFGPEDAVTREQLATFLMRFAAHEGFDVSSRADLSAYGDASDIGAFARDALSWGVARGLFKGIGETMTLAPQDDSTRAQMAALLMRFCQSFLEE